MQSFFTKVTSMAEKQVFTETGIQKLNNLILELQQLKEKYDSLSADSIEYPLVDEGEKEQETESKSDEKKNTTSEYSKKMLEKAIASLILLRDNNGITKLNDPKIQETLFESMQYIDGNSYSYAPAVFNQHSYEMALIAKKYIDDFNINSDLNPSTKFILDKFVGNVAIFYQTLKLYTDINIQKYDYLINTKSNTQTHKKIKDTIGLLSAENIQEFNYEAYQKQVLELIKEIKECPQLYIASHNVSSFDEPNKNSTNLDRFQGSLFDYLMKIENFLNEKLSDSKKPTVAIAYEHIHDMVNRESMEEYENKCRLLLIELHAKVKAYNNEWSLTSKDGLKKKLVSSLESDLKNCLKKQNNWGSKLRDFELRIDRDIKGNYQISKNQGIEVGRVGKILAEARVNILNLTSQISVTNDAKLAAELNKHVAQQAEPSISIKMAK